MPIVPVKNGTHSITVECADLTNLIYSQDKDAWICEYSDWAYGLFAICASLAFLLPIIFIIYCCTKYQNRHSKYDYIPEYSRQTSYSSVYPNPTGQDLNIFPEDEIIDPVVRHHKPKKVGGKLYFPYPAYGTCDQGSFLASTSSLYPDLSIVNTQHDLSTQPTQYIPDQQQAQLIPTNDPNHPFLLHLSSSAPVVTSMLRDSRQRLGSNHNPEPDESIHPSVHSLNGIDKSDKSLIDFTDDDTQNSLSESVTSLSSTSSPIYIKHKEYAEQNINNSANFNGEEENTSQISSNLNSKKKENISHVDTPSEKLDKHVLSEVVEPIESPETVKFLSDEPSTKLSKEESFRKFSGESSSNDILLDKAAVKTKNKSEKNPETASNISDKKDIQHNPVQHKNMNDHEKNKILSATPDKNMFSRQDFDDYLADCVLKLPEDQRNGTFLIRNSTSAPNCKVLTLYCKSFESSSSLFYFKIPYNDDGMMSIENTMETFYTLDELISFHKSNRSVLPCLLGDCLGKNF